MTVWLILAGAALITFSNRFAFLTDFIRYQPSVRVRRFLSYSSYSVLTAIWVPIVFHLNNGKLEHAGTDYLLAVILAATLSFFRVASLVVVIVSISTFFAIRYLL